MINDALSLSVPPDSPPTPDADPEVGDGLSLAEPDDGPGGERPDTPGRFGSLSPPPGIVTDAGLQSIARQMAETPDPDGLDIRDTLAERHAALHVAFFALQRDFHAQADALRAAEIRAVAASELAALREADVARLTAELADRRAELDSAMARVAELMAEVIAVQDYDELVALRESYANQLVENRRLAIEVDRLYVDGVLLRKEIVSLRAKLAPLERVARLALPLCQTLAGWSFNRDVEPGPALAALREAIRDVDGAMATGDEGSARPPGSLGSPEGGTGGGSGDGPAANGEATP